MTTWRGSASIVLALAALGLAGCGPSSTSNPPQGGGGPAPAAPPAVSPFPPPPIEIGSGDDKTITWMIGGVPVTDSLSETNGRLTDEVTWKIQSFSIVDSSDVEQTDVQWAAVYDGATELANIAHVGGQFFWKVNGVTPEVCSRYDVTSLVPACMHNGTTTNNVGIPSSLFNIANVRLHAAFKRGGTAVEEDVKKIKFRGRTCQP